MTLDMMDAYKWVEMPQVALVISNPPYITSDEKASMHMNVLQHEPHLALFVQDDAMEFYDAISKMVMQHQMSGCYVLVEINEHYGAEVCHLFESNGLAKVHLFQDLQGKDRIVMAQKP